MEDEINLRDLIETVLAGKWLIAAVTAMAVGASGVLSWFLTPVYEARARLMVVFPARQQPAAAPDGGLNEILRALSAYPDLSLESYRQQIENPVLLQQVVDELGLPMTRRELEAAVEARALKDTNLIEIVVSDRSPQRAAQIANKLAELFTRHMTAVATTRYQNSVRTIESQMEEQNRKLQDAVRELRDFLAQPRGVAELTAEAEAKTKLLAEYRTQQVQLEVEERALAAEAAQLRADLTGQPPVLETRKVLADDPLLHQIAGGRAGDPAAAAGLELRSQEVNPVHTELAQRLAGAEAALAANRARRGAVNEAVRQTGTDLERLRAELAEKQARQDLLQQRVDSLKAGYQALAQKLEEARLAQSSRLAETNVVLVSPAMLPLAPVRPQKLLNLALAGVLGLMGGTFLVLVRDFWRRSAPGARGFAARPAPASVGPTAGSPASPSAGRGESP